MEDLPAWPASVFEDPTTLEIMRTCLTITKNKEFASTVKKWRIEAKGIQLDIDSATEGVQMDLMSAREFLNVQTLTETRANQLKSQCEGHSKSMSKIWKKVNKYKINEFL